MRILQIGAAKAALFNPQEALDQLPNSILILDKTLGTVIYANTAAEVSLKISRKSLMGVELRDVFGENSVLEDLIIQFKLDGLMRNLAHEIKNPLGGIRGAAQLLDYELPDPSLKEYTKVMIKEVDRLQTLVDRLLAPHKRQKQIAQVNIHEVLERVRSVVLAEFAQGLSITRFYDVSLPEIIGDKEILIQALLNIVHNAAQILEERIAHADALIRLETSISRNITIARKRFKLALNVYIIDNGPGISADIIDHIFLPLVSGRPSGSGLGLTLAQSFIQMHGGFISVQSEPGKTIFHILIPYTSPDFLNNIELRGQP